MPAWTVEREREDGRLVLRVKGNFDRAAASELRDLLTPAEGEAEVVLDFSLVRQFEDLGVAALARLLAETGARRIGIRGLRQHQVRLFRYIGFDVDALGTATPPGRARA